VPPLLKCQAARIESGGATLLDGLSCETRTDRVGLLGAWEPLFSLLGCRATLSAGELRVHACAADQAVASGVVGLALSEPGLPENWTASEYLEQSARLAGCSRATARSEAREALRRLGLEQLGKRKLGMLAPAERRLLQLAHATLCSPPVLALETPLAKLDDAWAQFTLQVLDRAWAGRRVLVSISAAPGLSTEQALLDRLDEILVLSDSTVLAQGRANEVLSPGPRYLVVVSRGARGLIAELANRGLRAQLLGPADAPHLAACTGAAIRAGEAARLLVQVPEPGETGAIVEAALVAQAPILELSPLPA
jgi:ABC-type Na+ transport system ATPase subunit NatA